MGLTRVVKYTYLDAVALKTLAVGRALLWIGLFVASWNADFLRRYHCTQRPIGRS